MGWAGESREKGKTLWVEIRGVWITQKENSRNCNSANEMIYMNWVMCNALHLESSICLSSLCFPWPSSPWYSKHNVIIAWNTSLAGEFGYPGHGLLQLFVTFNLSQPSPGHHLCVLPCWFLLLHALSCLLKCRSHLLYPHSECRHEE